MQINEVIKGWDAGDGKPMKGSLIDMGAWDNGDGYCAMCAQGQILHLVGGWEPERMRNVSQMSADCEVAKLLNISRAHAVLLRNVNDSVDGAPSIVLTDPIKVLGGEWSKLLDFWWHMDQMDGAAWDAAGAAAWDAAGAAARAAAGAAARDAAGAAARAAAWDAAWDAAGAAAWEIQGAHIFTAVNRPFYFLPMFGFASPSDIPARPANYGVTQ